MYMSVLCEKHENNTSKSALLCLSPLLCHTYHNFKNMQSQEKFLILSHLMQLPLRHGYHEWVSFHIKSRALSTMLEVKVNMEHTEDITLPPRPSKTD